MERNNKGQFVKGCVSWCKGKKNPSAKNNPQIFKKGQIPWNKGKPNPLLVKRNKSLEMRKKVSKALTGRVFTKEHRRKLSEALKGRKAWNENKRYLSPKTKGKNHWNWKGGVTPESQIRLHTPEWDIIRKRILKRDRYTCQKCGVKKKLDVHHKKPWRIGKDDNDKYLISLCRKCHMREERLLSNNFST